MIIGRRLTEPQICYASGLETVQKEALFGPCLCFQGIGHCVYKAATKKKKNLREERRLFETTGEISGAFVFFPTLPNPQLSELVHG